MDLPTGETTTATGTHPVRPPGALAEAEASIVHPFAARSPARPEPARQEPDREEPDREEPTLQKPVPVPQEPFVQEPFGAQEPFGQEPAAPDGAVREYGDPVGDLVRAAVADRPLEEVVDLIMMLERSPQYAQATIDALRAVGVNRSVEDVTRLVGLLTRPPRQSNSADEAIRAAAECRSVEDVTRLMELLHRTPLEPHCGQEAVRAAATGRPVEELVQLIGRLAEDGLARADSPDARRLRAALDGTGEDDGPEPPARPAGLAGAFAAADRRGREGGRRGRGRRRTPRRERERERDEDRASRDHAPHDHDHDRTARRSARGAAWPTWLTVAVLAGCGVAYFPLHQNDASARAYGAALGLSALCLVLALLLTVRPAVPLLAAAVVAPAALASAKLYGSATPSTRVSEAVDLTLAPTWIAVAVAVLTSLIALTALCVRVASQASVRTGRRPVRPMTRTSGVTD
ncbi:hypothetical protein GCM10022384_15850 [Streptomyces marokkonensis]|uniref:Uncharacterized protein n=1 Tax=Streptomyces marokkonensis TaxID=324855 RepID=A0ABP7PFL2_9ACTN